MKANMTAEVILILLTVTLLTFFGSFVAKSKEVGSYVEWKTGCEASVDGSHFLSEKLEQEGAIVCPTIEITSKAKNPNEAMHDIGKHMVDCWDIFKEGDVNILHWDEGKTNYCAICQTIAFEKSFDIPSTQLFTYFKDHNVKNTDTSILHYFTHGREADTKELLSKDVIDTSKVHHVVFTYTRDVALDNPTLYKTGKFLSSLATFEFERRIKGFIVELAFGGKDAVWQSGLSFVPAESEDLTNLGCDVLPLRQYSEIE